MIDWKLNHDYRTRDGRRRRLVAVLDDGNLLMASVNGEGRTENSFVCINTRDGRCHTDARASDHDIVGVWRESARVRVYLVRSLRDGFVQSQHSRPDLGGEWELLDMFDLVAGEGLGTSG